MAVIEPKKLKGKICVFCGASFGKAKKYKTLATQTGEIIAENGLTLIYGAGGTGLMGAVAMGALSKDGKIEAHTTKVIAEIEEPIVDKNVKNKVHKDLAIRKRHMIERSNAFIALPGGIGTIDEISDVLTSLEVGESIKKPVILIGKRFWKPLYQAIENSYKEEFISKHIFDRFFIVNTPKEALKLIKMVL